MPHPRQPQRAGPTPSREEIAKAEIGHTDSTRSINGFLCLFFLLVITAVPLWRTLAEFRDIQSGRSADRKLPRSWDALSFLRPTRQELAAVVRADSAPGAFQSAMAANDRILRDIAAYERDLKEQDNLIQWLVPRMQTVLTGWLKAGSEDAYCGRDGWLFYRRDVDSLTGPGFLEARVLRQRAATGSELRAPPQPDPVKAIVDFHRQLAARGIALLVMPAPVKPSIHPEFYSRRYVGRNLVVQNPSFEDFKRRLADAGVAVFDPSPVLAEAKAASPGTPLYLKTDTHWTPTAMESTARRLAGLARQTVTLPAGQPGRFSAVAKTVKAPGDIALMLRLPPGPAAFPAETVQLRQVVEGERDWRPDPRAEVLLLGDSFANIYSLEPMGWGESAGLAEHLSLALGLPVDALCRNDSGSHATREMLARELQRGHDRLAGKKLVIWEFAARELAFGDWKLLPLQLGERKEASFYSPKAGQTNEVRAIVRAASRAPRPGSVPYKDHILTLHLAELECPTDPEANSQEAVVFTWSMRDNQPTPAARLRPGDPVRLRLQPWSGVARLYEAINRSELDEDRLLLADPAWGEEPGLKP
jgi:alginate O-acetyltransferase complex protein AlgJ